MVIKIGLRARNSQPIQEWWHLEVTTEQSESGILETEEQKSKDSPITPAWSIASNSTQIAPAWLHVVLTRKSKFLIAGLTGCYNITMPMTTLSTQLLSTKLVLI